MMLDFTALVNPFQPSVAFHIEASHLICSANQIIGFYMKRNTGLEWFSVPKCSLLFQCFQVLCSGNISTL